MARVQIEGLSNRLVSPFGQGICAQLAVSSKAVDMFINMGAGARVCDETEVKINVIRDASRREMSANGHLLLRVALRETDCERASAD